MTARDAWGQVAHDLRALADSIDRAIEFRSEEQAAEHGAGGERRTGPGVPVMKHSAAPATTNVTDLFCPEHGVEKRRPGKKGGFFCSFNKGTRDDPDWCSWRVAA